MFARDYYPRMDKSPPAKPPTITYLIARPGAPRVVRKGLKSRILHDIYHRLLHASWSFLLGTVISAYLATNVLFALIYTVLGGIENARPGSFVDSFFFSIQTMATIGYGKMAPISVAANVLVTLEALLGMLFIAVATGLLFAKFARPRARGLFSRNAVVSNYDGVPALMFRMANERTNQVVEAQLKVIVVANEITKEGERLRRMRDLKLVRSDTAVFSLTWLAIHLIDESSPLHGLTREDLVAREAEIVVSFLGYDETFGGAIHARHSYIGDELSYGGRFVDILSRLPDGSRQIDYTVFHDVTT
jgi:inward rectifier potassium channel